MVIKDKKYLNIYKIIYFIFISNILCEDKKFLKIISDSEIILTIKGNNTQQILGKEVNEFDGYHNKNAIFNGEPNKDYKFDAEPSEILVNGKKVNYTDYYVYNLTLQINNITIKFNQTLRNCNIMFYGLSNITNIFFIDFDTSSVTNMDYMFYGLNSLTSLDLRNFNTSSVTTMVRIFHGCSSLKSLDINNFNTSSVTNMFDVFCYCSSLISLDLSNFNTTSVLNMGGMFYQCKSLISLYLSNFNTSSATIMRSMFCNCNSLISLDLSSFNPKSVINMDYMFQFCNSLISVDLSNFYTLSVNTMLGMFYNCTSLISLDLRKFDTSSVNLSDMANIFDKINPNLIYCINNSSSNTNLRNKINSYSFKNNNICSNMCFNENKKIIFDDKICVLNCTDNNKYNYNNICYKKCPNDTYNISNNICIKYNKYNDNIYSSIIINTSNIYSSNILDTDKIYSDIITENYFESYSVIKTTFPYSIITDNIHSSISSIILNTLTILDTDIYNYLHYFNNILDKSNNNDNH